MNLCYNWPSSHGIDRPVFSFLSVAVRLGPDAGVLGGAGCAGAGRPHRPQTPAAATPAPKPETGIPITDQTVVKACGSCHRPDEKQQLSRISFRRTTPEGWERTITRMMALNGLKIDAPTARVRS